MIPAVEEAQSLSSAGIGSPPPASLPRRSAAPVLQGLLLAMLCLIGNGNAQAGTVSGHVRYEGLSYKVPTIFMSADPVCDKLYPQGRPAEILVIDEARGLANVLVYVTSGLPKKYTPPPITGTVLVDQKACAYVPHVVGVRAGQEIEIRNGDPTIHNVDARPSLNTAFNVAMPAQNQTIRKTFNQPEVPVKLKCDIHPWMNAYIGVFDHPFFAVSGADGSFTIGGLPDGEYTIEAWHELLGSRSATLEVDEDDSVALDLLFVGN